MTITSAHGGGGKLSGDLIQSVFLKHFSPGGRGPMEDAALLDPSDGRLAFTTDSFVVTPLSFPGGDIGRLSICGTVNDLLTRGARPKYLSCGFILEEGLDVAVLDRICRSMAETADEAGVQIVTGDTKVIGGSGGLYINTAGIGFVPRGLHIGASEARPGDAVIVSGTLGDHHACILSQRMGIENGIQSDCAPLGEMVHALLDGGLPVHVIRDITRGGLATVLNEIAADSGVHIKLTDGAHPVDRTVGGFCDILGLEPLYMGNEGKLALLLPEAHADAALSLMRASRYGINAQIIGRVAPSGAAGVSIATRSGGTRALPPLLGEGLPRIC